MKGIYDADGFVSTHEYLICSTKNNLKDVGELAINDEQLDKDWNEDDFGLFKKGDGLRRTGADAPRSHRPKGWFPVFIDIYNKIYVTEDDLPKKNEDKAIYPLDSFGNEMSWSWSKKKISSENHNLIVSKNNNQEIVIYKKQRSTIGDIPTRKAKSFFYKPEYSSTHGGNTAKSLFGFRMSSSTPKSVSLIQDIIALSQSENNICLDYFAGSGTTGHAVINLNREDGGTRKYILVEMGNYFDTVTKPRIEKVVYSTDWKNGKPVTRDTGISHCFKYIRMESYEDTLNNLTLQDQSPDLFGIDSESVNQDYLINYMLDIESKASLMDIDRFDSPFDYQIKIHNYESGQAELKQVDFIETFN